MLDEMYPGYSSIEVNGVTEGMNLEPLSLNITADLLDLELHRNRFKSLYVLSVLFLILPFPPSIASLFTLSANCLLCPQLGGEGAAEGTC